MLPSFLPSPGGGGPLAVLFLLREVICRLLPRFSTLRAAPRGAATRPRQARERPGGCGRSRGGGAPSRRGETKAPRPRPPARPCPPLPPVAV